MAFVRARVRQLPLPAPPPAPPAGFWLPAVGCDYSLRWRVARAVSHANPVMTQARWKSPPWFISVGARLNAALASPKPASMTSADPAE